jgi:hypothetical protein
METPRDVRHPLKRETAVVAPHDLAGRIASPAAAAADLRSRMYSSPAAAGVSRPAAASLSLPSVGRRVVPALDLSQLGRGSEPVAAAAPGALAPRDGPHRPSARKPLAVSARASVRPPSSRRVTLDDVGVNVDTPQHSTRRASTTESMQYAPSATGASLAKAASVPASAGEPSGLRPTGLPTTTPRQFGYGYAAGSAVAGATSARAAGDGDGDGAADATAAAGLQPVPMRAFVTKAAPLAKHQPHVLKSFIETLEEDPRFSRRMLAVCSLLCGATAYRSSSWRLLL